MKRALKVLAWLVGILLGLIVAAVIVLPLVINPNDYRDEINTLVEKQTGRQLTIEGNLDLSVFPWLGVEVGKVRLGNAPGFGPEPFASFNSAQVRIKLLPLLHKKVEVDTVRLDDLILHLSRNAKGVTNWQDLIKPKSPAAGQPAPAPKPGEKPSGPPALGALALGGLQIRSARVDWDDRQAGRHAVISQLDLTSGALVPGQPFPVSLDFHLANNAPQAKGTVHLKSQVTVDLNTQHYTLDDLSLDADVDTPLAPGGNLTASLGAQQATVNLQNGQAQLDKLRLESYGAVFDGDAKASRITDQPSVSGTFRLELKDADQLTKALAAQLPKGIALKALDGSRLDATVQADLAKQTASLDKLTLTLPGASVEARANVTALRDGPQAKGTLEASVDSGQKAVAVIAALLPPKLRPGSLDGTSAKLDYSVDLPAGTMAISGLQVNALGVKLTGSAKGRDIVSKPQLAGTLKSNEFVPRDITGALGIELPKMADQSVLTKAALGFDFAAGSDQLALDKLKVQLDQSTLTGSASVGRFNAPRIRYNLALDQIDVDRYLPPPSKEKKPAPPPAPPASAAAGAAIQLPLDLLRGLDIDGRFSVGKLKAANLHSSDILAVLKGQQGKFRLNPTRANLYQGSYQGDVGLDMSGETPRLAIDERLSAVQAGPLLKDLLGEPYITGTANLAAKLTARGIDPMAVRQSLSGNASFHFTDGAVKGISLGQLIRQAYAKLKGQPEPPNEAKQTDFAELRGSVRLTNGLARNDDLSLKSPLLRVTGKGQANLARETLDYLVTTTVVSSLKGQGGKESGELKGVPIPVRVTGTFGQPKFSVDLAPVLEQRAREALDREKSKAQEKAKKRLEEEKKKLQQRLQDQFKNLLH